MEFAISAVRRSKVLLAAVLGFLAPALAPGQLLTGANWFEREVGDGVVWRYYQFDSLFSAKQSVSYMTVDLTKPGVDVKINFRNGANVQSPAVFPRAATSTFAAEVANAKAAINGTYFNTASYNAAAPTATWGGGTTYLKVDGNVVHAFDGSNVNNFGMGIRYNSKSDMQIARKSGGWSGQAAGWSNVMVCGPVLVENGAVETYDISNTHATARHPRSAVGISADGNTLILLAVDGRTSDAAGMSCTELAQVIKELGADDAINLDGGGSTTLWAAGEPFSGVVNYPSDNGAYDHLGQRSAANALIVTASAPTAKARDARVDSITYNTTVRQGDPLTVTVGLTNVGTATWTPGTVTVVPSRAFGRTSAFVPAGQENTFYSFSPSTVATGQTTTLTIALTGPVVAGDTAYMEHFALWHSTNGWFGPADNNIRVSVTARPPLAGAPPPFIVQGSGGPNNAWYSESGGWAPSSVPFSAAGVTNGGSQRYCSAGTANRFATFAPIFDVSGVYTVQVAYPYSSNNITNVTYTVNHRNGASTSSQNQNVSGNGNTWQTLGNFEFEASPAKGAVTQNVVVGNGAVTGNRFYSGAVRMEYIAPLPGSSVPEWQWFD